MTPPLLAYAPVLVPLGGLALAGLVAVLVWCPPFGPRSEERP